MQYQKVCAHKREISYAKSASCNELSIMEMVSFSFALFTSDDRTVLTSTIAKHESMHSETFMPNRGE